MKNISKIFGIIVLFSNLLFSSACSTSFYLPKGNISVLNYNGDTLRKYENASLHFRKQVYSENVYLNSNDNEKIMIRNYFMPVANGNNEIAFIDEFNESHFISGGIIIIDKIEHRVGTVKMKKIKTSVNTSNSDNDNKIYKLLEFYKKYSELKEHYSSELKNKSKMNNFEYKAHIDEIDELKRNIKNIDEKLNEIRNTLIKEYNYYIN